MELCGSVRLRSLTVVQFPGFAAALRSLAGVLLPVFFMAPRGTVLSGSGFATRAAQGRNAWREKVVRRGNEQ